jgi:SAM-dependent methyltransferase
MQSYILTRLMIFLILMLIIVWVRRVSNKKSSLEGFSQDHRFVAKYDADIYDDFYVNIYDTIHIPKQQLDSIMKAINMTLPSEYSTFLDIGCGTGTLINKLDGLGYNVYGIDKSQDMVNFSQTKYPTLKIKCDDFMNPMVYDKNTFSHILCSQNTIYMFKDKVAFFRNCYLFMKPNAHLIVHLVDVSSFNPISPVGKPLLLDDMQSYTDERITISEVDFVDFTYKSAFDFSDKNSTVITETFVDISKSSIRQNQQTLYTESIEIVVNCAKYAGFLVVGQINMKESLGDENQYLFMFERTL